MFTIMMMLTAMLSSLSTQDSVPSHAQVSDFSQETAVYRTAYSDFTHVSSHRASAYPAASGSESINGLTLQNRIEDADRLYGKPSERVPAYMGGEEYRYDGLNVGVYEGWIYYVSVPASTGSFNLNGRSIPMDVDRIRDELGKPDFTADDGFGYEHDGQAIKIFVDPLDGKLRSVDLFDSSSV
ncbi:hypothetical protein CDO73_25655 [Saccharibacillus sp. O23]|uniref:hypothetical protein n=1 Tax=Saccharibacillus sp. O23 TaxID=2009338 RepID=UPI000B4E46F9|nr:hypothetical protein [Saccharibacillus sp. O23]OWR26484.1 hypothetical protein CDO73_25655 [Saccharibacillus sp. O23]